MFFQPTDRAFDDVSLSIDSSLERLLVFIAFGRDDRGDLTSGYPVADFVRTVSFVTCDMFGAAPALPNTQGGLLHDVFKLRGFMTLTRSSCDCQGYARFLRGRPSKSSQ